MVIPHDDFKALLFIHDQIISVIDKNVLNYSLTIPYDFHDGTGDEVWYWRFVGCSITFEYKCVVEYGDYQINA